MNGRKRWVSAKNHRKTSSKSSFGSIYSPSSFDDRLPPSPPIHLPSEDITAATTIVDFGSGSTLATQRSEGLVGGPPTVGSNSSIDSITAGLTSSPSTTPPKKSWEKNYRSFLKKTGKHDSRSATSSSSSVARTQHTIPIKSLPRLHIKPARSSSHNASSLAFKSRQSQSHLTSHHVEDFAPGLADGFEDHSQYRHISGGSAVCAKNNHPAFNDDSQSYTSPPSPSKQKESTARGGVFFKRIRCKTKSVDNLDSTMRRGADRKSPTTTPPASAASAPPTPISKHSPVTASGVTTTLLEGAEKTALLNELLFPPTLASSGSLGCHSKQMLAPAAARRITPSQGDDDADSLDQPRHRGHSVSIAPKVMLSQKLSATPTTPALFSRVQSMGSNLIIPEGKPVISRQDEEELVRERRKAFTDFHNMGIDSSSAYLGDESSLHKQSVFWSSMAYPVGSAGGKVQTRHTCSGPPSGPRSLDQRRDNISPSTSMNSISENKQQHNDSDGIFSPERSLRSLKGPEHWTKGERHAIVPGVLCMCPIQVLNNVMSSDEGSLIRPSLKSLSHRSGFGIGSIVSEDDGADSSEWFFADHHQSSATGGNPLLRSNMSTPQHAAFGKILLGKATVAPLGMRSFLNEVYGWCTGVFVLRQNYLFEYREGDSLNGLPWGYAHLPLAEVYPHQHFTNALHLDFLERPCTQSGKRSLLLRVESKNERDRWVSLLQSAARMTIHDLYDVDESEGAPEFGRGRYAVVRPSKRRDQHRATLFSDTCFPHATLKSRESLRSASSLDSLVGSNKTLNADSDGGTGEYDCALKIIDKKEFWSRVKKGRERADTLVREGAVQATLAAQGGNTPGFLRLRNIFETEEKIVLELELLEGTDLFQHITSHGVLGEVEAAHIMRDLLNCLQALDQIGIAHRDIKPANLLMCHNESSNGVKIKLADFGMASFVGVDNLVRGRCGTPGFVAPEILLTGANGGYGNKVDVFSAGVTLYVMLAGYEPFYGESDAELIKANREAKVDFPHADWHSVSVEGRDLIERMLVVDPWKRIGPSEALRHPWITRRATAVRNEDCIQQAVCSIC